MQFTKTLTCCDRGKARLIVIAVAILGLAGPQAVHADWGFQKVFDFSNGYPGTGANISVSGTNPSIHNDIVMFGVSGGGGQGIFRYERGSLISFADNRPGDSFTSVSVSSFEAHDPFAAFIANQGSGNGLYTRSFDNQNAAFPIATPFTSIPSGSGNFTSFGDHSSDGQRVTFIGFGSSGQRGIYVGDVNSANTPSLVIEKGTPLPGGGFESFQSFSAISHRNNFIVFTGSGNASSSGVYFRSITGTLIAYGTVASTNTTIPRQATTFTALVDPSYNGQNTAFRGFGSGVSGIYTTEGGSLRSVADTGTAIPQANGNFTSFGQGSLSYDGSDIAFEGNSANTSGVYIERNGVLEKVIAAGDVIDGRTVSSVSLGRDGLSAGNLAMRLSFIDGSSTFYGAFSEHRWDPDGGAGSNWDDPANWPMGARPSTDVPTFIEPTGPALVQGPTTITQMRSLTLGSQGAGIAELRLQPTGQVLINETLTVQAAGKLGGDGALHATGGVTNMGEIDLGNNSVTLSGGLIDNHGLLRGNGRVANRLNNHPDGEVRVGAGQTIRFTGSSNSNNGEIRLINGGIAEFTNLLTNTPSGRITGRGTLIADGGLVNAGDLLFSGGFTDVFGDVTQSGGNGRVIVSGGSTTSFYDDVVHNGAEIRVASDSTLVFFGDVTGSGGFNGTGTVHFEGTYNAGNSPGQTSFGGSVVFGATATLAGELAGTGTPQFDQIDVTDNVSIEGTLEITLLNSFAPDYFNEFEILAAGTRSGEFDSVTGALVNPDMILAPVYDRNANIGVTLVAALPGDANLDGTVNGDDLLRWQANLFSGDEFVQGDFNLDGAINGDDLLIWQSHLFDTVPAPAPATAPIPEPGTAVLLLGMSVLGVTTRRRAA